MFGIVVENQRLLWREDLPQPQPAAGEVLIKVAYAGVNRADIYQKQGKYPPPAGASPLLGLEVSGEVVNVGRCHAELVSASTLPPAPNEKWIPQQVRDDNIKKGDKVAALLEGGGYAEYATVRASQCLPIPEGWSLQEAAILPEALYTCHLALVETAELQAGEVLLIHGGASGIGSFAIQLARCLGAIPIVTVGTAEKADFCRELGAERAICYREVDFSEVLPAQSVDVILDMVGGDYMPKNLKLLKRGGRLVQLAFQRGAKAEVNMAALLLQNLHWQGVTLRSQTPERKAAMTQAILAQYWPWLAEKRLKPIADSVFPLQNAEKAHERMEQNLNLGKIALEVSPFNE
jgi:NADPH2:quinone reductase